MNNASHASSTFQGEILFDTNFDYLFEYLCSNSECLLPNIPSEPGVLSTIERLMQLGTMMADPGAKNSEQPRLNSTIPAIYTYLGQFIDHTITARTDREEAFEISDDDGEPGNIVPASLEDIVEKLKNGRRPMLDLDSLFGDGPSFSGYYSSEADAIYEPGTFRLRIEERANGYFDLKRDGGKALIGDARNDENLMVSQLHAIFIKFYNRIYDRMVQIYPSPVEAYSRARRLTCWAFQYVTINDYLPKVCDEDVVRETLLNGPYYFLTSAGVYMPLEFSVAGFRFGHSMIRPFYKVNDVVGDKSIQEVLGTSPKLLAQDGQLDPRFSLKWGNFVKITNADRPQMARLIDPKIAKGLFLLNELDPGGIPAGSMMAVLTQRNLLRGYLLRIPTGQSIAKAMRITPLTQNQIMDGFTQAEKTFLMTSGFAEKSPLWFYILQEAAVQQQGQKLGIVGSKLVAETLIGLVKEDRNSYFNNQNSKEVELDINGDVIGIKVAPDFRPIKTIADIIELAQKP